MVETVETVETVDPGKETWELGINPAAEDYASNELVVRPAGEFPHGEWVADCGREYDDSARARAAMVAAAPDLYRACRAVLDLIRPIANDDLLHMLTRAVLKAENR